MAECAAEFFGPTFAAACGVNSATNQTFIEDLRLVDIPAWWQNPWVWLAVAIATALVIYGIRRLARLRHIPLKMPKPGPPPPPPHLEALARLAELRQRHAGLTAYQVALECSDILRRYVEARFQSSIRYQTTREFLGAIHSSPELNAEARRELGDFLEFFDGIKFAQETAGPEQTAGVIDGAERFVRRCSTASS